MRLSLQMVRRRPTAVLATVVAALFCAGMTATCAALLDAGLRYHGSVARYAAAPVLVAAPEVQRVEREDGKTKITSRSLDTPAALPGELAARLAADPAVGRVVADTAVPATVAGGRPVQVALHPWSAALLTPLRLTAGRAPAPGQVVLDVATARRADVRVGAPVRVWTASGPHELVVAGTVAASGAHAVAGAYVAGRTARDLLGTSVQVLGVLPRTGVGTARLTASVRRIVDAAWPRPNAGPRLQVLTGVDRGRAEDPAVEQTRATLIAMSGAFGGSTLLVAAFVVANTVGLSVRQRRQDIALLRAVAATPRQVRRMVTGEALAVGVLAAVPGVLLARWGTQRLRAGFVDHRLVPADFSARLTWLPALIAGAATVVVAAVAAWVSTLRASRVAPRVALTESVVEPDRPGVARTLAGVVVLAGGIVVQQVAARVPAAAQSVAVPTIVLLALAAALLGPVLLRGVALAAGRVLAVLGPAGRLAAATVATSTRRVGPVFTSVVLAVGLTGGLYFVLGSERHAAARQAADGLRAGRVVVAPDPGLDPDALARLRAVPGVRVTPVARASMIVAAAGDLDTHTVQGVDAPRGTLDLGVTHGSLDRLRAGTVAVDRLVARDLHLRLGDTVRGWLGDGRRVALRVVAIYDRGLGFADLTVSRSVLPSSAPVTSVLLAGPADALARAAQVVHLRAPPGTRVVGADGYRTALSADAQQNAWADQVLVLGLLSYVALAAGNTLVLHTVARRREFGVQRLAGATRGQLLRGVAVQLALVAGPGVVVGAIVAAAALVPSVHALTGGSPYLPTGAWLPLVAGVVAFGIAAAGGAAVRVLRGPAIVAAASRD